MLPPEFSLNRCFLALESDFEGLGFCSVLLLLGIVGQREDGEVGQELSAISAEADELGDWIDGHGNDPVLAVDGPDVV